MIWQRLKEFGRRLAAPEAIWRLDSRKTYAPVPDLCTALSYPIYMMSKEKRELMGMFYATFPETAAFLIQRIAHECMARTGYEKSTLEAQAKQGYLIGVRLFGTRGQAALSNSYGKFIEENEEEAAALSNEVRIIVHAGLFDGAAIRNIKDYEAALLTGMKLAEIDPAIIEQGEDYVAVIGKHWMMCGVLLKVFEPWVTQYKFNEAIGKIIKKQY